MNTVKYKAWTDEGMITVRRITFAGDICYVVSDNDEHDGCEFQIDTKNLRQFTGLTDKAGVEIYDGDIVSYIPWGYVSPVKDVIEYNDKLAKYDIDRSVYGYEVIGNIYENKELLNDNL